MNSKESVLNPTLKANTLDSLQYLTEINLEVDKLKDGSISEEEFIRFVRNRSKEFGYISDFKHTFKVMEEIKKL